MRKMMLLAVMVAMAVMMMAAAPAMADDRDGDGFDDDFVEEFCEDFDGDGFCEEFFEEFCEDFDGDFFCDDEDDFFFDNKDDFFDDFDDFDDVFQENELEAESGDVDQTFTVVNTGDNANQCVGINGTANTGNAQNVTDFIQFGGEADDFEFDDSGALIDVSGTATTTCDQQVNQAASAF